MKVVVPMGLTIDIFNASLDRTSSWVFFHITRAMYVKDFERIMFSCGFFSILIGSTQAPSLARLAHPDHKGADAKRPFDFDTIILVHTNGSGFARCS
jgi:hypothetical protein